MKKVILIVDDEKNTREGLRNAMEDQYDVCVAGDIAGAKAMMETEQVDLLLTDLRLGGESGMDLLSWALRQQNPPACIMMTAYGGIEDAVEAMKHGAYDFVIKPVNIDRLDILVKRALHGSEIERENTRLREQIDKKFGLESFVGESPAITRVLDTIRQVAPSRATVLITGESGTGKELAAHAIHQLSPRRRGPFIAVHCAALSPQLLESELFGHEKGSFTGATERRIGRFEQAAGGTLFLDEIGEIDAATQVKILRVLGERVFERVGGNKPIQADVRLVAATNRDLARLVAEGKFREDLYFRLNVVQLHLPPLRDRSEDIPLLAEHFLREAARENEKPVRELTSDAMKCLLAYSWPGNVRELRAAIEHGVVMANGPKITLRDLPVAVRESAPAGTAARGPLPLNLGETEISLMRRALAECKGNRTLAAEKLGISRRTLHRKLREHPE
ncbi:MAG: sigma-54-dependent transcriptional regulator, partial [Chthoniobacterales bacterium]